MEQGAYAVEFLAGLFFMIAGARLIRLSRRTGEAPERLLGISFALTGVAYVGWTLPYVVAMGPMAEPSDFAAWIVYSIGCVPYLLFVRVVFRPGPGWPQWLVIVSVAALALSATVLTLSGDRYPGLANPFFWIQWLGYTAPCVWLTIEAVLCRRNAVRRARIGLADPIIVNRYLLLGIFGLFQVFACLSDILMGSDLATYQAASGLADILLGGSELAGIATLWLAFFPPKAYLDWVIGSRQTADVVA